MQSVERIVAHDETLAVEQLSLRVEKGSRAGESVSVTSSRLTVGGAGSDVVLDEGLKAGHLVVLVSRGRVMLSPGSGVATLNGERLTGITPAYPGEEISLGESSFVIERSITTVEESRESFGEMVATGARMKQLFGALRRISAHSAPVLLLGESGTGKELAARGLHAEGPRAGGPFVALNCGAIAEGLFESELFGHEKGAFTGASSRTDGALHRADGGTLFLDEIGELPLDAQAKLLRALESGEVRRVGGATATIPDVRVVAATHRDLQEDVQEGRFREDLYFRLAVLGVRLPALRERLEDLPIIVEALCGRLGGDVRVTREAMERLTAHGFPGNFRELRNVLTRAYVLFGPVIVPSSLSFSPWASGPQPSQEERREATNRGERKMLEEVMRRHQGNRSAAARELGIARTTLHYKLRKLGVE